MVYCENSSIRYIFSRTHEPIIKIGNFETIKHSYVLNNKSVKSPLRYDIPYQSKFLTFETDGDSKLYFHFYLDQKEDFAGEEKTKYPLTMMESRPGLPLSSPSSVEYKFRLKTTNMDTLNIQLMNFNPIFPKQSIPTASVEISQGKVYAISREYNFSVPVEEYRSSDNGPPQKRFAWNL